MYARKNYYLRLQASFPVTRRRSTIIKRCDGSCLCLVSEYIARWYCITTLSSTVAGGGHTSDCGTADLRPRRWRGKDGDGRRWQSDSTGEDVGNPADDRTRRYPQQLPGQNASDRRTGAARSALYCQASVTHLDAWVTLFADSIYIRLLRHQEWSSDWVNPLNFVMFHVHGTLCKLLLLLADVSVWELTFCKSMHIVHPILYCLFMFMFYGPCCLK